MKQKYKSIMSLLMTIILTLGILGSNLIVNTNVSASEGNKVETSNSATVNYAIKILSDELSKKGAALKVDQWAVLYKAGVKVENKKDILAKEIDTKSTVIGTKVKQAAILMDMDEDPANFNGKNFIKEISDEISKLDENSRFSINEIKAITLLDRYNEKYKDSKVDYNVQNAVKLVIENQNKSKGTVFNVPQNVAWGLNVFVKHRDIDGVKDAEKKAMDSVKNFEHDDSGFYLSKFGSGIHAEAVSKLVSAGVKLDSTEWIKVDKNPIDALFNSWDGKEFQSSYGGGRDETAYEKVLDALAALKNSGYGDYVLKGTKFKNNNPQKEGSSINQFIDSAINYYNNVHFVENQGQLKGFQYSALYRTGADLSKKNWYLVDKYESSYDTELKNLASKVNQSLILLDINKNPNDYNNRHFIDEIKEEIDKNDSYFRQSDIQAVIAIDKYNEKYPDKKVSYNYNHAVKKIIEAQCDDGGFKQSNSSVPRNTGYALMALSKHKDAEGVDNAIKKAIWYIHNIQKDDGGLYDTTYVTGYHAEVLQGLIAAGENPTSEEWTKSSGKNPVDALFKLWKDNGSFDGKEGESVNNKGWLEATWKSLYTLLDLKDAGYGNYIVNGVKISNPDNPKEEKTCKVNVAIVMPKSGGYDCMFTPKEVTISDKKQDKGFTALGALQAATSLFQMNGDMVTSIYGYENKDQNGWMYSVNGAAPNNAASKVEVKEGDKIVWYYSLNGMESKIPSWEELTDNKKALSAKVKVRVEANDHTIVTETELTVNNFDLTPYGSKEKKDDKVFAIHALIKALESKKIDCKDVSQFDSSGCTYIKNIAGVKERSVGSNDGWMYYVNDKYAPDYMNNVEIHDGDSIVVFFQEDYLKNIYTWFENKDISVKTGESFKVNLKGSKYDISSSKELTTPIDNAKILIDNKELVVNGQYITTDKDGNAQLKFDTPGTYIISAVRFDKDGKTRDITRPYCKVIVEQGESSVNKDTLEKFIDEAQNLVDHSTVGTENGQYPKESMDKLSKELTNAKSIMDKSGVSQTEINAEVVKLQSAISAFKDSINKNQSVQSAIDDVVGYYNSILDNQYKTFDFITTLALRRAGMDTDKLVQKMNIYGMDNLHNYSRNIMTLIGANKNPRNHRNKDYVDYLIKYDYSKENNSEYIAKAVIALDMAEADYDKAKLVNILLGKAHDEGNGKISFGNIVPGDEDEFGEETEDQYNASIEGSMWTLIALANHKNIDNCNNVIEGIKKYIKAQQKESGLVADDSFNTSLLIQALIALGENPNSDTWNVNIDGNKVTLLDAVLKCKIGNSFALNPKSSIVSDVATPSVLAALSDLKYNTSMYKELKYKDTAAPVKISIDGEKAVQIYNGQSSLITAKAYDYNNVVVSNTAVSWKSSNDKVVSVKDGTITGISEGEADITAYITGNESIKDSIKVKVVAPPVIDYSGRLKNEIEFLKDHYKAYKGYEFLASPAAVVSGLDKNEVANNIYRYSKNNTALQNAKTIIALLGAGLDPKNDIVKEKTNNYVETLEKAQSSAEDNKGKFIVNALMDEDSIEAQAWCILALDAAGGKYDKEAAVKALLAMINSPNYKNASSYKAIKTEALALAALGKHKDIKGAQTKIYELENYLKQKQNNDGGFDMEAGSTFQNSPVATAAVVMALHVNGIDPLSFQWTKNGKTVIDSMEKAKFKGSDPSKSGYCQGEGLDFENSEASYYAFAAYVELLNKKSIFDMIDKAKDPKDDSKLIEITNESSNPSVKLGNDSKVSIKAVNNSDNEQNVVIVVALYDESGNIIKSISGEKIIKKGDFSVLNTKMNIPQEGKYTLKAFVCESFENSKVISNTIDIPIK
ncbi:DUF4430 domain-containing protein [Clostridium drakei]|uniref:Transcobalamin-like C-terminal domain-containing protein n=1 Tax=Clostridium drakei TaxID=332101 RepID=A0A2U8DTU7_9CLOT|nr:DUF4430 domain-containing protein [Clostridium drakei]AWI05891.1 hypothetical protein B9W14_15745 [Clostridium drakei]